MERQTPATGRPLCAFGEMPLLDPQPALTSARLDEDDGEVSLIRRLLVRVLLVHGAGIELGRAE